MTPTRKRALDNSEKQKYNISQDKKAYLFEFDKIIEERCDEFDYQLESDGYTIVFQDLEPAAVSIFNYTVIAYK